MHIEWAHDQQARMGEFDESVQHNATLAVAEATLALVEQQRIANLISIWTLPDATKMMMVVAGGIDPKKSDETATQIMAALGLS